MAKHPAEVFGYSFRSALDLPKKGRKKYWCPFAYDLSPDVDKCNLFQTRIESSTVEDLFNAFRNNPNIPSRATFLKKLETKLNAKMELKLELSKV